MNPLPLKNSEKMHIDVSLTLGNILMGTIAYHQSSYILPRKVRPHLELDISNIIEIYSIVSIKNV